MSVTIKYVENEIVALSIHGELFYIKQGPGIPKVFDEHLRSQTIPNIDHWLQAKTQQRYSYRGICDMAAAFAAGLKHSYTSDDLRWISAEVVASTVKIVFRTEHARDYALAYWVELLRPAQLFKFVEHIRSNFDKLKKRYDHEELYNILCRLWQFSNFHAASEAAVFETLIRTNLARIPQIPKYPDTTKIDQEIEKIIIGNLFGKAVTKHKGIDDELINNVKRLRT